MPSAPVRTPLQLNLSETIELADGTTVTYDGYVEHPSGSAGVTLQFDEQSLVLVDDSAGHHATGWVAGHRLTLGAQVSYSKVELFIDQRSQTVAADHTTSLRIERGTPVPLDDGLLLSFRAHGHKHVMSGGPSSPLIVRMEYLRPVSPGSADTQSIEQASYNLFPPASATWQWRDYQFQLRDHAYDRWMDLEISRLEMVPASL